MAFLAQFQEKLTIFRKISVNIGGGGESQFRPPWWHIGGGHRPPCPSSNSASAPPPPKNWGWEKIFWHEASKILHRWPPKVKMLSSGLKKVDFEGNVSRSGLKNTFISSALAQKEEICSVKGFNNFDFLKSSSGGLKRGIQKNLGKTKCYQTPTFRTKFYVNILKVTFGIIRS